MNKTIVSIMLFIFVLLTFGAFYAPAGIHFQNRMDTQKYIDRTIEDSTFYPARSPQAYIWEHLKIISPVLCAVFGFVFLWRLSGAGILVGALLKAFHSIFILVALWLICLDPLQFIILLIPLLSSYLMTTAIREEVNLMQRISIGFLLLWCQIVLGTEMLSSFSFLNPLGYLIFTGFVLAITTVVLRPKSETLRSDLKSYRVLLNELVEVTRENPLVAFFLSAVLFSLLWRLLLVLSVPPNNSDGLGYHLARIAFWMQHGSMQYFDEFNFRIVSFPRNSEIMMMWTMISSRSDVLCGLIQFFAYLGSGILLLICSKDLFKADKMTSLIVALVWMSMPENVLQSTTVQNDMTAAYFLMTSLVFFLLSDRTRNDIRTFVSATALGLAIGIKTTTLFYVPAFVVILILSEISAKGSWRQAFYRLGIYLLLILALGSFSYITNYVHYNNPFSSKVLVNAGSIIAPSWDGWRSVISEHVFNLCASQTGLQFYFSIWADHYNNAMAWIGERLFDAFHVAANVPGTYTKGGFHFNNWILKLQINEDFSFFGFSGAVITVTSFLMILLSLLQLALRKKNTLAVYVLFACVGLSYLAAMSYKLVWDPWSGRFLTSFILLASPLLVWLFQSSHSAPKTLRTVLIIYSIIFLVPTTFMNEKKPLVPYKSDIDGLRYRPLNRPEVTYTPKNTPAQILSFKRIDHVGWTRLSLNPDTIGRMFILEPYDEKFIRKYYASVPPGSRVGTLLNFWHRQYPLFGEKMDRTLIPLTKDNLRIENFDYIIISALEIQRLPGLKNLLDEQFQELFVDKVLGGAFDVVVYAHN